MTEQKAITFQSIEQVPPGVAETQPLTDEERQKVEDATRYEREGDYVNVASGRRFVTPIHKCRL